VIFKDSLNSSIAGIVKVRKKFDRIKRKKFFFFKADYRVSGENLLICCSNEGEIRGYKFSAETATIIAANIHKDYQEAVRELAQKKKVKKND